MKAIAISSSLVSCNLFNLIVGGGPVISRNEGQRCWKSERCSQLESGTATSQFISIEFLSRGKPSFKISPISIPTPFFRSRHFGIARNLIRNFPFHVISFYPPKFSTTEWSIKYRLYTGSIRPWIINSIAVATFAANATCYVTLETKRVVNWLAENRGKKGILPIVVTVQRSSRKNSHFSA